MQKIVLKLEQDEKYVGTPENPTLSKDTLDAMIPSRDAMDTPSGPCDALDRSRHNEAFIEIEKGVLAVKC